MSLRNAIVLVPTKEDAYPIEKVSQDMAKHVRIKDTLGQDGLVHITIAQTDASLDTLENIISQLNLSWSKKDSLTLVGLCFLPASEGTWIEIPTLRSDRLSKIHALSVESINHAGYAVLSGAGDNYRPHITVGFTNDSVAQIPKLNKDTLRATLNGWTLKAVRLNELFSVPKGSIEYGEH